MFRSTVVPRRCSVRATGPLINPVLFQALHNLCQHVVECDQKELYTNGELKKILTSFRTAGDDSKIAEKAESKLEAKEADIRKCVFLLTHL